jgi:hypothetical protein
MGAVARAGIRVIAVSVRSGFRHRGFKIQTWRVVAVYPGDGSRGR